MKKTLKTGALALSILLGSCIFVQTNVYAKDNAGKGQGKAKVHASKANVKTADSTKKTTPKTMPYGLAKKTTPMTMPYGLAKKTTPPVIKQGGLLIPVNAVTKSLGANLVYDSLNQIVTVTKENTTIVINLINKTATVNGTVVPLPSNITEVGTDAALATGTTTVAVTDTTLTTGTDVTGTETTVTPESTTNSGTLVLFNFIATNLGVTLDETQLEQVTAETLLIDSTQTLNNETVTTSTTDVQASSDLQN